MRIAAAMDIQRVVASQAQRFGQRHFKDRGDFIGWRDSAGQAE